MWRHALLDEFAATQPVHSATVAADLSKFYERIGHQRLVDEAVSVGYPLGLLRLNIDAYRGFRRCSWHRAFGEPVRASRSVGAGCSHAHL